MYADHKADENPDSVKKKKTKTGKQKLPKSVFALYIKLYCNKKETRSVKYTNKLIEATKSWVTLSEVEKQKFYEKYKECQQIYSINLANCLQKSEPFMKKKRYQELQEKHLSVNGEYTLDGDDNETNFPHLAANEVNEIQNDLVEHKTEISDDEELQRENSEYACVESQYHGTVLQEPSNILYPEPLPPNLKSGKELFEIIQLNSNIDLSWTSLTQKERSLYNQAVLTMKRDYIHKYKQYLENLTSEELFHHYNKYLH